MKKFILTSTIVTSTLFIVPFVHAQTPTSSQLRDAVQKQVQEELSNIKQDVAKKGFVGNITAKSDGSLTMTNLKNQSRTVLVTGDTTIKLASGNEGTPADLKVNDFIIAMGNVDSQNKMTSTRLLVTKQSDADKRDAKYGVVTKTTSSSISIGDQTIKVSSSTGYSITTDGKIASAKLTDIKAGSKIVYTGTPGTTNAFTATSIHIVP